MQGVIEVRNMTEGMLVLTPDISKREEYLKLEGNGHEGMEDIAYVTRETVQNSPVIQAAQKGLISVSGLADNDPLHRLTRPKREYVPQQKKPVTVEEYVYDNKGNKTVVQIEVQMDPRTKG
jgi:uncharacterized protein YxeA